MCGYLAGTFNVAKGDKTGIYQAVWVGSTTDSLGIAHPNTRAWLGLAIA